MHDVIIMLFALRELINRATSSNKIMLGNLQGVEFSRIIKSFGAFRGFNFHGYVQACQLVCACTNMLVLRA